MLRRETRVRARALQILYAWEVQGRPPFAGVAADVLQAHGRRGREWEAAVRLGSAVADGVDHLDAEVAGQAHQWRLDRLGIVERTILRLALHELDAGSAPAPVVIDEAVRLAHWFAGPRAPGFVNGVLDALARAHGRL